MKLKAE